MDYYYLYLFCFSFGYDFPSNYNPSDIILGLLNTPIQNQLDSICESFQKCILQEEIVKECESVQLMAVRNQLVFGVSFVVLQ